MPYVPMDPPGTWCFMDAFGRMIDRIRPETFLDVGCGGGANSAFLLGRGSSGIGLDFSEDAIRVAGQRLAGEIEAGRYELVHGDIFEDPDVGNTFDLVMSLLVMEHVEDDLGFLRRLAARARPGGHVLISVPGRKDRWSFEDETVGHLRRYDRDDLHAIMRDAGLFDYALEHQIPLWIFVGQVCGKWTGREDVLLDAGDLAYLRELHDKHPHVFNRDLWNWFGNYACPAGKLNVVITSYGDVIPCPFIQISYGNLLEENIDAIHARLMADPYFRDYHGVCLAAEHPEFMERYIKPLVEFDQMPVPRKDVTSTRADGVEGSAPGEADATR